MSTSSRKEEHVNIVASEDVRFRSKTTGLERYELVYNALPEVDLNDISTATTFLGRPLDMPLLISCMTGGYEEAIRINAALAEACNDRGLALGVGSARQALEDETWHESFRVVRRHAPTSPIITNIGATHIAKGLPIDDVIRIIDLVEATALAVHLNPLQEVLQPEGTPRFSGVLDGIERLVRECPVPVIVKEVGAGISGAVAERLINVGVRCIDVAGAGGTSWAGVEILRRGLDDPAQEFWDVGIPTADCLVQVRPHVERVGGTLISSGGISGGRDMAISIALGAHLCGSARPVLQAVMSDGVDGVIALIRSWERDLRRWMFLSGCASVDALRFAPTTTIAS